MNAERKGMIAQSFQEAEALQAPNVFQAVKEKHLAQVDENAVAWHQAEKSAEEMWADDNDSSTRHDIKVFNMNEIQ